MKVNSGSTRPGCAARRAALGQPVAGCMASWHDIATALGTSPEQAELQYSPRSPLRDTREPYDPD